MTDNEVVRFLAEKVMGWEVFSLERTGSAKSAGPFLVERHAGKWDLLVPNGEHRRWNPLTSIADAFEVQAAMRGEKCGAYIHHLRLECGCGFPVSSFGSIDLFRLANATARQRDRPPALYRCCQGYGRRSVKISELKQLREVSLAFRVAYCGCLLSGNDGTREAAERVKRNRVSSGVHNDVIYSRIAAVPPGPWKAHK